MTLVTGHIECFSTKNFHMLIRHCLATNEKYIHARTHSLTHTNDSKYFNLLVLMRFLSTFDSLGNKFIMVGPTRLDSTRHNQNTARRYPNKVAREKYARLPHALPQFIGMFIIIFLCQVEKKNVFEHFSFASSKIYIVAWNLKFQLVFSLSFSSSHLIVVVSYSRFSSSFCYVNKGHFTMPKLLLITVFL